MSTASAGDRPLAAAASSSQAGVRKQPSQGAPTPRPGQASSSQNGPVVPQSRQLHITAPPQGGPSKASAQAQPKPATTPAAVVTTPTPQAASTPKAPPAKPAPGAPVAACSPCHQAESLLLRLFCCTLLGCSCLLLYHLLLVRLFRSFPFRCWVRYPKTKTLNPKRPPTLSSPCRRGGGCQGAGCQGAGCQGKRRKAEGSRGGGSG